MIDEAHEGAPAPRVAAIVLNYNGREVTLETLSSLVALDYPAVDLVVVDNGSSDGSREAVAAAYPQVTQLVVEVNQGISFGLNRGIRWALEQGHDYVLLLNNDIEAHPDMLSEMVRVAEADPSLGCIGPKAYYYWQRDTLWSAGGILRFRESVTRERGEGEIDRGQYDRDEVVDYVNGCAMLVRRQAILDAGLWDPTYVVCVEDADFCVRVKRAGYRCFYAHRAVLWHMVSASVGGYKAGRTFHTGRSSAIFARRHATLGQRLRFLAWSAVALPVAFLRELPRGNHGAAVAKARGILVGLREPLQPPPAAGPAPAIAAPPSP